MATVNQITTYGLAHLKWLVHTMVCNALLSLCRCLCRSGRFRGAHLGFYVIAAKRMQETGSLTDAKNLLCRLIIRLGFQKDMRFDGLGDASLAGAAGCAAEREMGVLNDAVARER